jgi:predicted metal-dependent peptidase
VKHLLLSKAKAQIILNNPFFASILMGMPMIEDNSVPTMGVDGEKIMINVDYLNTLSLDNIQFVLAHEALHCVFQHMFTLGDKDAERWNHACDYVINDLLSKEKNVGIMPKGGLLNADLVKRGGGTAEGVYALLPSSPKAQPQPGQGKPGQGQPSNYPAPGQPGGALDQLIKPSQDQAELSQKQAELNVRIIQARNIAKACGKLSAGIDRLVSEAVHVDTPWKDVLRQFFSERAKIDPSYGRPKLRFLAEDLILPSLVGERMGKVVVAVDCSGSINERLLALFSAELNGIMEDVQPSEIQVIYFDSKVLKVDAFTCEDLPVKLTPVGGGGTMFSPIFEEVAKGQEPAACVVLTDLYCDDFGPAPTYPVLWASTVRHSERVPFGSVIFIKGEK